MPTTIFRRPQSYAFFTAGGHLVDVPFLSTRASRGFDQQVATCDIELPYRTARLSIDTWVNAVFDDGVTPTPAGFVGRIDGYTYRNWAKAVTLHLTGPLGLARSSFPPDDIDIQGFADDVAIRLILLTCGIPLNRMIIQGTGQLLGATMPPGDQRAVWKTTESGLDKVMQIDEVSLGYRTFDAAGSGLVLRRPITSVPSAEASYTFTGGVNIGEGASATWDTSRGREGAVVLGTMDASGTQIREQYDGTASPVRRGYARLENPLIETSAQALELAQFLAREGGKPIMIASIPTPVGTGYIPGITLLIDDLERLGMNKRCWLQNVTTAIEQAGGMVQNLTAISEIVDDPNTDDFAGEEYTDQGELQEPPAADFAVDSQAYGAQADFRFAIIDHEVDESDADIWVVVVEDASWSPGGAITAWSWTTSTTTVPETGSQPRFVVKVTDIATEITLEVTDATSQTATVTKACNSDEALAATIDRHIYVAGNDHGLAYDGNRNWNSQPFTTTVVGNGPLWNEGQNVRISTDELATDPASVEAFASQSVSALWCETDFNSSRLYAGGDQGSVSVTTDGGSTWVEKAGPSPDAVIKIIASRFVWDQITILDAAGEVWQSQDNGDNWGHIASHPGAVDFAMSNFRNWICGSFGVALLEDPSATMDVQDGEGTMPFPAGVDIVSIAAHIREDRAYAYAEDGTTYWLFQEGGDTFAVGEPIPAGTAQVRGLTRDGAVVDLIYVCTGMGGLYKSSDGLRTAEGYHLMHSAETLMVGYGDSPINFSAPTSFVTFFAFSGGSSGGM